MLRALGVGGRPGFQEVSWSFWGRDSPGGRREGRGGESRGASKGEEGSAVLVVPCPVSPKLSDTYPNSPVGCVRATGLSGHTHTLRVWEARSMADDEISKC